MPKKIDALQDLRDSVQHRSALIDSMRRAGKRAAQQKSRGEKLKRRFEVLEQTPEAGGIKRLAGKISSFSRSSKELADELISLEKTQQRHLNEMESVLERVQEFVHYRLDSFRRMMRGNDRLFPHETDFTEARFCSLVTNMFQKQ